MDIDQALCLIKEKLSKNEFIESRHFKEECADKNLNLDDVYKIINNLQILGIVKQDHNLYKIWLFYTESKDLNVILKILEGNKLKLVTLFPCDSNRRKRQNAKG